jgi:hypothetical protein
MNECPTRVRSGTPPDSATISGTAREVIRLWMIVEPGVLRQLARGHQGGDRGRRDRLAPARRLTSQRSAFAVEGEPEVGAVLATAPCRSTRLPAPGGLPRGWERAVQLEVARTMSSGSGVETRRAPRDRVAGHAVAGVDDTVSGRMPRQVDERAGSPA